MIKKRYLIIISAIVAVLLGSLLYNSIAQAGKPEPEPDQVEVTNFPLDEEGNLRTTIVQTSAEPKIMVVFNETLTVSSGVNTYHYITSFNTSGFKHAYLVAKGQGAWQEDCQMNLYFYNNNFGIQTYASSLKFETKYPYLPNWGSGETDFTIHSTSVDLYLHIYHSDVGFDGLLTIVVHLTN